MKERELIQIGTKINDYTVLDHIGHGGFADVYRVISHKFMQEFAAKVIHVPKDNLDKAWQSFNTEINALKMLDHPNIIRLYEHFLFQDHLVLILEYCPGGSLARVIEDNGPMDGDKLYSLAKQLVGALKYSHSQCIAHHDIKPQNILFDSFGRPKLADFGISIQMPESNLCEDYHCSMAFAPPELINKVPHCPYKADVWSLGVLLAYACTGQIPFATMNADILKKAITTGSFILSICPAKEYLNLIQNCLRVDPKKRPSIDMLSTNIDNKIPHQIQSINSLPTRIPSFGTSLTIPIFVPTKSTHRRRSNSRSVIPQIHPFRGSILVK